MTLAGVLAFLGLGAITMDVLGGVIATGILLRGGRLRHLLAFCGGYALVIIPVTALLHPVLTVLGTWLRPILHSNNAIGSIEVVAGLALGALALHQWRSVHRQPSAPGRLSSRSTPSRLAIWPLLAAGLAFSMTALADPAFTLAVGMAAQEESLPLRIWLLVLWHLIYQAPLVTLTIIASTGKHDRLVRRLADWFVERWRALQAVLAVVLALIALLVLGDGTISLIGAHVPWLRQLLSLH